MNYYRKLGVILGVCGLAGLWAPDLSFAREVNYSGTEQVIYVRPGERLKSLFREWLREATSLRTPILLWRSRTLL